MRINSYGSIGCIRFEGIISALKVGTLLMFDAAKVRTLFDNTKFMEQGILNIAKYGGSHLLIRALCSDLWLG